MLTRSFKQTAFLHISAAKIIAIKVRALCARWSFHYLNYKLTFTARVTCEAESNTFHVLVAYTWNHRNKRRASDLIYYSGHSLFLSK